MAQSEEQLLEEALLETWESVGGLGRGCLDNPGCSTTAEELAVAVAAVAGDAPAESWACSSSVGTA